MSGGRRLGATMAVARTLRAPSPPVAASSPARDCAAPTASSPASPAATPPTGGSSRPSCGPPIGLLTLAGGIGPALYGVGIVTTRTPPAGGASPPVAAPTDRRRELAIGAATLALLLVARDVGLWPGDAIMIPATIIAIAVAVMWTPGSAGPGSGAARSPSTPRRVAAGVVLALSGVAALAERTGGLADVGRSVSAVALAVTGVAVIAAPALGRLLGRLDEERMLRVREEERATLAAHLHDSVLQSLVLIQRADDPRQMSGLARRQERELRSWLYGGRPTAEPTTLQGAVEAMTAASRLDHEIRVEAVTVGDQRARRAGQGVPRRAARGDHQRRPPRRRRARRRVRGGRPEPRCSATCATPASASTRRRSRPTARAHRLDHRAGRAGGRQGDGGEPARRRHRGRDPHPEVTGA